jgi:hypothetical protein
MFELYPSDLDIAMAFGEVDLEKLAREKEEKEKENRKKAWAESDRKMALYIAKNMPEWKKLRRMHGAPWIHLMSIVEGIKPCVNCRVLHYHFAYAGPYYRGFFRQHLFICTRCHHRSFYDSVEGIKKDFPENYQRYRDAIYLVEMRKEKARLREIADTKAAENLAWQMTEMYKIHMKALALQKMSASKRAAKKAARENKRTIRFIIVKKLR